MKPGDGNRIRQKAFKFLFPLFPGTEYGKKRFIFLFLGTEHGKKIVHFLDDADSQLLYTEGGSGQSHDHAGRYVCGFSIIFIFILLLKGH